MKHVKTLSAVLVILVSFSLRSMAQQLLPEVTVIAANYKYLRSVNGPELAQPVKMLERKAAVYNVKNSEYFEEDNDTYFISFYIPEGEVLAAYDKDGKLIWTAEKYKNIAIPGAVRQSVTERFPNWRISKDVYQVSYHTEKGVGKVYKLLLENGDKRMKVKTNEKGEFQ